MTPVRLALGVLGVALMAVAVVGSLTDPLVSLGPQLLFLAIVVVLHDGVIIPLALLVGWAAGRWLPAWARSAAQGALLASLALTVVAIPMIVNAGRHPDNPSLLPLDYWRGLVVAIGVCWLVAAAVVLVRWIRSGGRGCRPGGVQRRPRSGPQPQAGSR